MKNNRHAEKKCPAATADLAILTDDDLAATAGGGAVLSKFKRKPEPRPVEAEPMPTGPRTGTVWVGEQAIPFSGSPHRVLDGLNDLSITRPVDFDPPGMKHQGTQTGNFDWFSNSV